MTPCFWNGYEIREIAEHREGLMPLLLVGDEQESQVRKYIDDGRMYAAFRDGVAVAVVLVVRLSGNRWEIKNIAVDGTVRRMGLGRRMMEYVESVCGPRQVLSVGTGEAPRTLAFYRECGYVESHRVPDFFVDNYDHPVVDDGVLLKDMVYFVKYT